MSKIAIWYADERWFHRIYDKICTDFKKEMQISNQSVCKITFENGSTINFIPANYSMRPSRIKIGFVQDTITDEDFHNYIFNGISKDGELYKIKGYKDFKRIIKSLEKE